MVADNVALHPRAAHDETATLLGQTMGLVALTAGWFAVGAYLGRNMSNGLGILWFILAIGCLFAMNAAVERSSGAAVTLLFVFGGLLGLAVAPTLRYYVDTDPKAVWQAGAATALFIAAFGAAGYATRRDLSGLARGLFRALVGLLVFGVVLVFIDLPDGALIYAIVGLVIFAGYTAFDFQRLRRSKDLRSAPLLAASIFLDVINVFLLLLSIFGGDGSR
jgi:modulator of FtsH protease